MEYTEEEELVFKRFPAEKQEQVRGLVNYATLMGLDGKDLVSIGGKLDRMKLSRIKKSNIQVVESYECLPIGKDTKNNIDSRFKLVTASGTYHFERQNQRWTITSLSTKKSIRHAVDHWGYDLPKVGWDRRSRYCLLLDMSSGKITLNF